MFCSKVWRPYIVHGNWFHHFGTSDSFCHKNTSFTFTEAISAQKRKGTVTVISPLRRKFTHLRFARWLESSIAFWHDLPVTSRQINHLIHKNAVGLSPLMDINWRSDPSMRTPWTQPRVPFYLHSPCKVAQATISFPARRGAAAERWLRTIIPLQAKSK